jgi:thiosulfate/3-mercaptopyruvate sulfurtransferase
MDEYAHPESLVGVADHGNDSLVRLVEVDVDTSAYEQGRIPGAVGWNWQSQLQQSVRRDLVSKEEMEQLLRTSGINNNTTIVLYGDNNNWFACWAFWQLKYYGHDNVKVMNGGRVKWVAENRPAM